MNQGRVSFFLITHPAIASQNISSARTSSTCVKAFNNPSTMCARVPTLPSWWAVLRRMVSNRNSRKHSKADLSVKRFGTVPDPINAKKLPEKLVCNDVFLNRLFYNTKANTMVRLTGPNQVNISCKRIQQHT